MSVAIRQLTEGRTISEICVFYGRHQGFFQRRRLYLSGSGLTEWKAAIKESWQRRMRGRKRTARIFSPDIAQQILVLVRGGVRLATASRMVGLSPELVRQWRSRGLRKPESSTGDFARLVEAAEDDRQYADPRTVWNSMLRLNKMTEDDSKMTIAEVLALLAMQDKLWTFDNAVWDRDIPRGTVITRTPLQDKLTIRRTPAGFWWLFTTYKSQDHVWSEEAFESESEALHDFCAQHYFAIGIF